MSGAQRAGLSWENEVVNALGRATGDAIRVFSCGWSGNGALPATDIVITDGVHVHGVELKRHSCDRGEYKYVLDEDDFEQLVDVQNQYTRTHVGISFTNCEMLLVEVPTAEAADEAVRGLAERAPEAFKSHVTASGKLRLTKPVDTDVWPSAVAGRSAEGALADHLGYSLNA